MLSQSYRLEMSNPSLPPFLRVIFGYENFVCTHVRVECFLVFFCLFWTPTKKGKKNKNKKKARKTKRKKERNGSTHVANNMQCITQDNILDLNLSVLDFLDNNTYQNREYFFPANILGMVSSIELAFPVYSFFS